MSVRNLSTNFGQAIGAPCPHSAVCSISCERFRSRRGDQPVANSVPNTQPAHPRQCKIVRRRALRRSNGSNPSQSNVLLRDADPHFRSCHEVPRSPEPLNRGRGESPSKSRTERPWRVANRTTRGHPLGVPPATSRILTDAWPLLPLRFCRRVRDSTLRAAAQKAMPHRSHLAGMPRAR